MVKEVVVKNFELGFQTNGFYWAQGSLSLECENGEKFNIVADDENDIRKVFKRGINCEYAGTNETRNSLGFDYVPVRIAKDAEVTVFTDRSENSVTASLKNISLNGLSIDTEDSALKETGVKEQCEKALKVLCDEYQSQHGIEKQDKKIINLSPDPNPDTQSIGITPKR